MKTRTFDPIAALATLLFALALLVPRQALASVEKKGAWPTDEKPVSFKYQGPRADGLDKLASAAGWSLVVTDKSAVASDRTIALSLTEQPPADVLEALLDEGEFVATRKGTLVRIDVRDAGAADVTPPKDAATADGVTTTNGDDDVKVMGGHGEISKGRVARHVTVMGGSCDVYGRVTGDLSVMGGRVTLHDGAVIERDITTMGGHVEIEKGAEVRGHTLTLGGTIHKDEGAKVGEGSAVGTEHSEGTKNEDKGFLRRVGDAISNTALLFVLGVVMLAVAPKRMETLRVEVARSPMRQVGLGIVGFVGFLVAVVVLCITVVGIPVALIGVLLGVVGLYGGMVAALTVLGAALVRHKSENVYVHLAVGCGVFLVVYPLPFVGPPLTFALLFVGVGVLVSTRFAGYFPARKKVNAAELDGEGPYR